MGRGNARIGGEDSQQWDQSVLRYLGDPHEVAADLAAFEDSRNAISSRHDEYLAEFPNEWIVVYANAVLAHGKSLDSVLAEAKGAGCPLHNAVVRFMGTTNHTLIL